MRFLLLLLLIPSSVSAGPRLLLIWDLSRTTPTVASFRITITDLVAQQQDQLTVEPSAPGACGPDTTEDTFCAQLPTCPPPGVYALFVQAMQGATMTTDEDANQHGILCQVLESAPCQCAPTTAAQLPTTAAATTPAVVASNTASPTSTTGTLSTLSTMQLPTLPTVPPLDAMTT